MDNEEQKTDYVDSRVVKTVKTLRKHSAKKSTKSMWVYNSVKLGYLNRYVYLEWLIIDYGCI